MKQDNKSLEVQQPISNTLIIKREIEVIQSLPLRHLKYRQIIFVIEDRRYTERELPELPKLKFEDSTSENH